MDTKSILIGVAVGMIAADVLTHGEVHEAVFTGIENLHQQVKSHEISFDDLQK